MVIENKINNSNIALKRNQQRGIPHENIDLLLFLLPKYYSRMFEYVGISKRIASKKSILRILKEKIFLIDQSDKLSDICILIKNNLLITTHHLQEK